MDWEQPLERGGSYPLVILFEGPIVIFGAGRVGVRKAESLAPYCHNITVVSREHANVPAGVRLVCAEVGKDTFSQHIPPDAALVISSFDDGELNHLITDYCKERRILVTNASDGADGTALFPNVFGEEGILVATYGGGSCPVCSYALRRLLDRQAPWLVPFGILVTRIRGASYFDKQLLDALYSDDRLLGILALKDVDAAIRYVEEEYGGS